VKASAPAETVRRPNLDARQDTSCPSTRTPVRAGLLTMAENAREMEDFRRRSSVAPASVQLRFHGADHAANEACQRRIESHSYCAVARGPPGRYPAYCGGLGRVNARALLADTWPSGSSAGRKRSPAHMRGSGFPSTVRLDPSPSVLRLDGQNPAALACAPPESQWYRWRCGHRLPSCFEGHVKNTRQVLKSGMKTVRL